MGGEESGQPLTEDEWKKIRKAWEADNANNTKALKLIQRDYKPGSAKHKKLDEVMKREKAELDVILRIVDIVHSMDKTLHPPDATPTSISTSSGQWASGTGQPSKFCQFCGSKMPVVALYCQSCGRRQL